MTEVEWHPYPKEKPPKEGWYLVTRKLDAGRISTVLIIDFDERFYWEETYGKFLIKAWAELPEPYKEPEPLDMHPDAIAARRYMENSK